MAEGEKTAEAVEGEEVGKISHFFGKISVGIIEVTGNIRVGDKIKIKGATTDFEQNIESMQIDHKDVKEAKPGDSIGVKLIEPVRQNDKVYKI